MNLRFSESRNRFEISFFDKNNKETFKFYIGSIYKNSANYLRNHNSDDIYLSERLINFFTDKGHYFDSNIFKINSSEVLRLDLEGSLGAIRVKNELGKFTTNRKKLEKKGIMPFIQKFSKILASDFSSEESQGNLKFNSKISIQLKNKLTYEMYLAENQGKTFLKMKSYLKDAPKQITISKNAGQNKLNEIGSLIDQQLVSKQFNEIHLGRVYTLKKDFLKSIKDYLAQ